MDALPDEVLLLVFQWLSPMYALSLSLVCKRWGDLFKDEYLWRVFHLEQLGEELAEDGGGWRSSFETTCRKIKRRYAGIPDRLIVAAQLGHTKLVAKLTADREKCRWGLDRALTAAIRHGHPNMVLQLIALGASMQEAFVGLYKNPWYTLTDSFAETPAMVEGLELLFRHGFKLHWHHLAFIRPKYLDLTMNACELGHMGVVRVLVREGVDPFVEHQGKVPFLVALGKERERVVEFLLADPARRARVKAINQISTEIDGLILNGYRAPSPGLFRMLWDVRGDIGWEPPLPRLLERMVTGHLPFRQDILETTCQEVKDSMEASEWDAQIRGVWNLPQFWKKPSAEVVGVLMKYWAGDVNQYRTPAGESLLHEAGKINRLELCKVLLHLGADPTLRAPMPIVYLARQLGNHDLLHLVTKKKKKRKRSKRKAQGPPVTMKKKQPANKRRKQTQKNT